MRNGGYVSVWTQHTLATLTENPKDVIGALPSWAKERDWRQHCQALFRGVEIDTTLPKLPVTLECTPL